MKLKFFIYICFVIYVFHTVAFAGEFDVYWDCNAPEGYWTDAQNWRQAPDSSGWQIPGMMIKNNTVNYGFAKIEKKCAVIDANHSPNSRVEKIFIGAPNDAALEMKSGHLSCNKFYMSYGPDFKSKFVQTAGKVSCESYVCLGEGPNSETVFKLLGGIFAANNKFYCPYTDADDSQVNIIVDGGNLDLFENVYLGKAKNTFTQLDFISGKIKHTGSNFSIAYKGKAIFNQTCGVFETDAEDSIRVGWINGSDGLISISGGKFIAKKQLAINYGKLSVIGSKAERIEISGISCKDLSASIEFVLDRNGITPICVKGSAGAKLGESNLLVNVADDFDGNVGDVFEILVAEEIQGQFKLKNLSDKYIFSYFTENSQIGKGLVLKLKLEQIN